MAGRGFWGWFSALALMLVFAVTLPVVAGYAANNDEQLVTSVDGSFSLPVPPGWSASEETGIVTVARDDGSITARAMVMTGATVSDALEQGWAVAFPELNFDGATPDLVTPPPGTGLDEQGEITWETLDGSYARAWAWRLGADVYTLFIVGDPASVAKWQSHVAMLHTGFVVTDRVPLDLAAMTADPFDATLQAQFDAYAIDLMAQLGVPGLEVAIVEGGQVIYARGYGVTEVGGSTPVDPDTLMMIGSTSKSFTTMMMATQVDDGLYDWDTPVVEVMPEFVFGDPALTGSITMANLVCACTGIPRHDLEFLMNGDSLTGEDIVGQVAGFEPTGAIGESFQYSNQMVATGGYAAAMAGGAVWGDLEDGYALELQQRVLDPVGMDRTTLSFYEATTDGNVAMPHSTLIDGTVVELPVAWETVLKPALPAGLLWSSVNDMGKYLIVELNDGTTADGTVVVSPENLLRTREGGVPLDATRSYALGWVVEDYHGRDMVWHDGGTLGFTSQLSFLPGTGLGFVSLANVAGTPIGQLLRDYWLGLVYGRGDEVLVQNDFQVGQRAKGLDEAAAMPAPVDMDVVGDYLGIYHSEALGEVDLLVKPDGTLWIDAGEFQMEVTQVAGAPVEPIALVAVSGPMPGLTFVLEQGTDGTNHLMIVHESKSYDFVAVPGD